MKLALRRKTEERFTSCLKPLCNFVWLPVRKLSKLHGWKAIFQRSYSTKYVTSSILLILLRIK